MSWFRTWFSRPPPLPAPEAIARPPWVDELLAAMHEHADASADAADVHAPDWLDELRQALQKQGRAVAKQGARLEAALGEIAAQLTALQEREHAAGRERAQRAYCDDVFDALDALEEAQRLVAEPHLHDGLSRVSERLLRFCERAGYTRLSPHGEPPDGRLMQIVGVEPHQGVAHGLITRVVRAAIVAGDELVREGEVIVSGGNSQ